MALNPIIEYKAYIINPGIDLALTGVGTSSLTATYADYGGGGTKKANCTLAITYSNVTWQILEDNSVTVSGNISGAELRRVATGIASNNQQEVVAWFNNVQTFYDIVNTASSGTYNLNIPSSFSVTVPPSNDPQPQYPAAIHFRNHNTSSHASLPDEFALGIIITNPNPPDYRPGAILRPDNQWYSHNRAGGAANILTPSGYRTMRTLNGGTDSGRPPEIWHSSSNKKNQRKIGLQG